MRTRTIQQRHLSPTHAGKICAITFVTLFLVGALAGWKCSRNPLSSPGSETNAAIIVAVVTSLALIWAHRRHVRRQWRLWLYPELLAIWLGLGLGFDGAQSLAQVDHYQHLLGLAVIPPLFFFVVLFLGLLVLQAVWRPIERMQCPGCLYNLQGLVAPCCPECGYRIAERER